MTNYDRMKLTKAGYTLLRVRIDELKIVQMTGNSSWSTYNKFESKAALNREIDRINKNETTFILNNMSKQLKIGETFQHCNSMFIASRFRVQNRCTGCYFLFHNGQFNECHAPEHIGCEGIIIHKIHIKHRPIEEIEKDYNIKGCRKSLILMASLAGSFIAALATATYYFYK